MRRSTAFTCSLVLLVSWCFPAAASGPISNPTGQVIYDNSGSGGTNYFPSMLEYGDEVRLKAPPPNQSWILTVFYFEYTGDFTPNGDEKARLRFYKNDGEGRYPSPKTVLFDSGEFTIEPGFQTKVFSGLSIPVPTTFTWTIQLSGLRGTPGDQAGLVLRPTPETGHSFKDFWVRNPSGWTLSQIPPTFPNLPVDPVTNPDIIENFGCRIVGVPNGSAPLARVGVRRQDDSIVVEWQGAGRLQVSDSASGPYVDVAGASSPYAVEIGAGPMKFWRLAN